MSENYQDFLTLQKVERYLSSIRPFLKQEGSYISIKEYKDNVLVLLVEGACIGCAYSEEDFPHFSDDIMEENPQIKEILFVNSSGLPV